MIRATGIANLEVLLDGTDFIRTPIRWVDGSLHLTESEPTMVSQ